MQDNLNNIIRAQRLQSDDIRYIIFQIVSALEYLHITCGIVHRDLKPLDIGINKDMSIKIIDLNAEQPKETDYVLMKWYRAPELLFAWKPSTEKVDLWSVGCIMAEFLCGRIIFAGRDRKLNLFFFNLLLIRSNFDVFRSYFLTYFLYFKKIINFCKH